jgi:DNA replication protein DnaC
MKFLETHFEDYLQTSQKQNLHPKLEKIFNKFPNKLADLKNIIFYGPSGVGKYTQMLKSIKKYSPSELKYEKKIG